jgi:tetratricopeptide (TPR) repeat protein
LKKSMARYIPLTLKSKGLIGTFTALLTLVLLAPVMSADKTGEDYMAAGRIFFKENNFDEAIASYTAVLKLEPQSVQALLNRGNAYCRRGFYDKAIEDYTEVIRLDPRNGKAYNNRAVAYWFNDEVDKSKNDARKAEELGITANKPAWEVLQASRENNPAPPHGGQPADIKSLPPETKLERPNPVQGKQP